MKSDNLFIKKLKRLKRKNKLIAKINDQNINKLSEKSYELSLYKKYKKYYDPGIITIIDTIANIWVYLNQVATSQEFIDTGIFDINPRAKSVKNAYEYIYDFIIDRLNNYLKIADDHVEIKFNIPPIVFKEGYNKFYSNKNVQFEELHSRCERIIKSLINEYNAPTQWIRHDEKDSIVESFIPTIQEVKETKPYTSEYLKNLKIPYTINKYWDGAKQITFAPGFNEDFNPDDLYFTFSINPKDCRVKSEYLTANRNSGSLQGLTADVETVVSINAYFKFPLEYAYWATNATSKNTFIEKLFLDFIKEKISNIRSSGYKKQNIERINPITNIKIKNQEFIKTYKFSPKSRTNKEGFCILKDGKIAWIPEIDYTESYINILKSAYDAERNIIKSNAELEKNMNLSIKNKAIYTDWINNKFIYTDNTTGRFTIIDLAGAVPLDPITIYKLLNTSINSEDTNFDISGFFQAANNIAEKFHTYDSNKAKENGVYSTIGTMKKYIEDRAIGDITLAHIAGKEIENENPLISEVIEELRNTLNRTYPYVMKYDKSIRTIIDDLKIGFEIILNYGKNYNKYHDIHIKALQTNNISNITEEKVYEQIEINPEFFSLPNLPNLKVLMPHQCASIGGFNKLPKFAIIDIAPGGGKSTLLISDILILLSSGKIKRALLCMPGSLVRNFASEIIDKSGGHINVFPITWGNSARPGTIRKLKYNLGFNDLDTIKYIQNMPKNTLFITSYEFVKSKSNINTEIREPKINYGDILIDNYPMVQFLRICGFDYIGIDESHKIKNEDADVTKAMDMLAPDSEFKRTASGTMIPNQPVDLVGQINYFNSAILQNREKFENKYGRRDSFNNKVIGWDNELGNELRNNMLPSYLQYIRKDREDWSFILPDASEHFHEVDPGLTKKQQQFYENILKEELQALLDDPKIKKMLQEGKEEDEIKIEQALKRQLAKVEIFINAPDENEAFRASLDENDIINLKSPKVDYIDKIITKHFADKDNNGKIILFCYNTAVSRHFMKYTIHKNKCIHYTAGDYDVIDEFKKPESKFTVLVANEGSLKEGQNLQIASRLIRSQTLWSPGDQEQALSRIFRPDFEFSRERIDLDWVILRNTLEVAKTARLISKIISNAQIDYADFNKFPNFPKDHLIGFDLISMSFETLRRFKTFEDIKNDKGQHYLKEGYQILRSWQDNRLKIKREKIKSIVEKRLGEKIDIKELRQKALIHHYYESDLPGSRKVYVPREPGSEIDPTIKNIKLVSASKYDPETDIETDEIKIERGEPVETEYGPGYITKININDIHVKIKGFPKPVKLSKSNIGIPKDKISRLRLKNFIVNDPMGSSVLILPKSVRDIDETIEHINIEEKPDIKINVSILNGFPILWAAGKENNIDYLKKRGWDLLPRLMITQIKNRYGIDSLIKEFNNQGILIQDKRIKLLKELEEKIIAGKNALNKTKKENFSVRLNKFLRFTYRKIESKKAAKPFVFIWDNIPYIAINTYQHQPRVLNKIKFMPKKIGFTKWVDLSDNEIVIFPFYNINNALKEIKDIRKDININSFATLHQNIIKLKIT